MKSIWLPASIGGVALLALVIWLAGIRVFVIQPIGAIPDGVTVIVANIRGLNFIDSPDAFCMRVGSPNLLCRGMVAARVAKEGTIIVRLPYSQILYGMTGAPQYR